MDLLLTLILCLTCTVAALECSSPNSTDANFNFFDQNLECFSSFSFIGDNSFKDIFMSWEIHDDILNMTLASERTSGYISIAFAGKENKMHNSDSIIGYETKEGQLNVKAYKLVLQSSATSPLIALQDEKNVDYMISSSIKTLDGIRFVSFSRYMTTADRINDIQLTAGPINLLFAQGNVGGDGICEYHYLAKLESSVDLVTSKSNIQRSSGLSEVPFVIFFSFFGFICCCGLCISKFCQTGLFGDLLLHMRIGAPPKPRTFCANKYVRFFICDAWTQLVSMTWSEFLAVVIYFAGCLILSFVIFHDEYAGVSGQWQKVTGWMMSLCLMMNLIPVTKNSILIHVFGVPYNRAIKYHRLLARISLLIGTSHFVCVLSSGGLSVIYQQRIDGQPDGMFGFIAYSLMIVMALVTMIRRQYWEIFTITHMLFIGVVVAQLLHVDQLKNYLFILTPIGLLLVDKLLFLYYTCTKHRAEVLNMVPLHDVTMMKIGLRNKKRLSFEAGNYCFICIPEIAPFEWHPFSISSEPGSETFAFHIKSMGEGTFTGKLYTWAQNETEDRRHDNEESCVNQPTQMKNIFIDGPYGRLSLRLENYKTVMLCGAGIGVTPLASILSELHSKRQTKYNKLRKVALVWVIRNSAFKSWFSDLFDNIRDSQNEEGESKGAGGHRFEVRIYNTNKPKEKPQHPLGEWDEEEEDMGEDMIGAICGRLGQNRNQMEELERVQGEEETGLKELVGRPNFRELFMEITGGAKNPNDVAVISCGPQSIVSTAEHEATRLNFHFHKESFFL